MRWTVAAFFLLAGCEPTWTDEARNQRLERADQNARSALAKVEGLEKRIVEAESESERQEELIEDLEGRLQELEGSR